MKKIIKNLVIGGLAIFAGATIIRMSKRRMGQEVEQVKEDNEELKREYIDLSDQLNKLREEKEELEKEVEEISDVKVKEYTA